MIGGSLHCVISQTCIFSTCSNPSTHSTFAVTPLVSTPLIRNQGGLAMRGYIREVVCAYMQYGGVK